MARPTTHERDSSLLHRLTLIASSELRTRPACNQQARRSRPGPEQGQGDERLGHTCEAVARKRCGSDQRAGQKEASCSAGDRHTRDREGVERLPSPGDRQTRGEGDADREAPERARGNTEKRLARIEASEDGGYSRKYGKEATPNRSERHTHAQYAERLIELPGCRQTGRG